MRGGSRKGSGRKAPDGKRVTLSLRVRPDTKKTLEGLKDGRSMGETIDDIVALAIGASSNR